jgi:hypothetical protein
MGNLINLRFQHYITQTRKARSNRWAKDVAHTEKIRSAYKFVTRISARDKALCKPTNKQEDSIKMDVRGILFGLDSSCYPLNSMLCRCEHVNGSFSSIKGGEFLDQLSVSKRRLFYGVNQSTRSEF